MNMLNNLLRRRWFWSLLTLAVVATLLRAFLKNLLPLPPKIVAQHKKPGEKLVVLFGDSITQGAQSYNYVELLAERMGGEGYRFMNAGIGGDTAYNLLQRIEPVVESQPDAVVIMVGTNDVQAYMRGGQLNGVMHRMKKLPQAVTLDWYIDTLRQIVLRLGEETSAALALCSIPVLGEDLDSPPRLFNGAVEELAGEMDAAYLPVYEKMAEYLCAHQRGPARAFAESAAGGMMMRALWDHNIRGRSWDDIAAGNSLLLTVDLVHFNHRGAESIADLIEEWLHEAAA
jgi:lysophospholipase L1-like esterase